jgi:hypothetical protein
MTARRGLGSGLTSVVVGVAAADVGEGVLGGGAKAGAALPQAPLLLNIKQRLSIKQPVSLLTPVLTCSYSS